MEALAPDERARFRADLGTALDLAGRSTVKKTRRSAASAFGRWATFCAELGHDATLSDIPDGEDKLCYLLVFGMRYRSQGARASGRPVKSGSVDKALLAVGKGFTDLGLLDPRKQVHGSSANHPVLTAFLKRLSDEDDPASRAYPANVLVIRALYDVLDVDDPKWGALNRHIIDLIIVAFYWLLRPAEYLESSSEEARSQAFKLGAVGFKIDDTYYSALTAPLNDENILSRITCAGLTFSDQKNTVRGEAVGHALQPLRQEVVLGHTDIRHQRLAPRCSQHRVAHWH